MLNLKTITDQEAAMLMLCGLRVRRGEVSRAQAAAVAMLEADRNGPTPTPTPAAMNRTGRKMSAATRKRMSIAQKARWAK